MSRSKYQTDRLRHQQGMAKVMAGLAESERRAESEKRWFDLCYETQKEERRRRAEPVFKEISFDGMERVIEEKRKIMEKVLKMELPPVGTVITGLGKVEERRDSENPERKMYSVRLSFFNDGSGWLFAGGRGGIRCILNKESVKFLGEKFEGYWEYVEISRIKVVAHSKSGRSVIGELVKCEECGTMDGVDFGIELTGEGTSYKCADCRLNS